jgi:hypothetical protein
MIGWNSGIQCRKKDMFWYRLRGLIRVGGKLKMSFVKNHISRDVNLIRRNMQAFVAFVHAIVPQEYTLHASK